MQQIRAKGVAEARHDIVRLRRQRRRPESGEDVGLILAIIVITVTDKEPMLFIESLVKSQRELVGVQRARRRIRERSRRRIRL